MRLAILSSLVLSALFAVTGCSTGAAGAHLSTTSANHVRAAVAEASLDSSWTPPGEMSFTLEESKGQSPFRSNNLASALPAPNRREVVRGQVHEAY